MGRFINPSHIDPPQMGIWNNNSSTSSSNNYKLNLTRWKSWRTSTCTWLWIVVIFMTLTTLSAYGQIRPANEQLPYCGEQIEQQGPSTPGHHPPASPGRKIRQQHPDSFRDPSRSLILVSTIDGRITALNATDGSVLWSHATKPDSLLASTLDNLKFTNEGKRVHLVPSLDGDLYTFDGEHMGSVPLSMDALLSNSMRVANDTVVSGGKEIRTYGIDRGTGRLKYDCGSDGCKQFPESLGKIETPEDSDDDQHDGDNQEDDVVVVRRLTKTVRAISARTGLEKWNYSVGVHEVSLASSPLNEGCHDEKSRAKAASVSPAAAVIKFMASEGIVLALNAGDSEQEHHWKRELRVPIVHAWQLKDNEMNPLSLFDEDWNFKEPSTALRPVLHVGMYNNQLYVLESARLQGALQLEWDTFGTKTYPIVTWKPYLISAHSRTPIILGARPSPSIQLDYQQEEDMGNTALVAMLEDAEYPYDGGFALYTNGMSLESGSNKVRKIAATTSANSSRATEKEEEAESLDQIIIVSLWYWWKEVLFISLSFAVLTNVCITRHVLHRMTKSKSLNVELSDQCLVHGLNKEIVTVQRAADCPASILVPSKEPALAINGEMVCESQHSSSDSSTLSASVTATPPVEFVSRYASDFEPIQKLGKGGFGVVVQARNKLDDCEYAIKRICMPNKKDRKARIMREVKALAKLDHVSIVRYYNAWLECPPSDWQDNQFSAVDQDGVFTPSSSMTCDELQSLYAQRGHHQQQYVSGTGDNLGATLSWSKPIRQRFVNNNNQDEKSFTISLPSVRRQRSDVDQSNDDDDSLNIVFEDSGCKSEVEENGADIPSMGETTSSMSHIQFKEPTKSSSKLDPSSQKQKQNQQNEKTELTSPFVWEKPEKLYLYIQMQLCRKDNLKDWLIYNQDNRDKFEVLDYFHQIVSAVEYVHEQGLIHRDLKPSNIFFAQDGSIKVGDFGLAASTTPEATRSAASTPDRGLPPASDARHTDQVGTGLYMSPEQAAEKVYDHKVDIFSLGLIFFEMLVPFCTAMERVKVMMDARLLIFPPTFVTYSPDEFKLTSKILAQNPQDRLSASDIKQHPLLQDFQPRPELLRRHRLGRTVSRTYSTSSSSGSGSGSGLGISFDKD